MSAARSTFGRPDVPMSAADLAEPSPSRSAAVFTGFSLLQRAIGFGRFLLLVWLLDPAPGQYALLMLSMYLALVLTPLATVGLGASMDRFVARHQLAGTLGGFLRVSFCTVLTLAALAAGLLGSLAGVLSGPLLAGGAALQAESAAPAGAVDLESLTVLLAVDLFATALFYWAHGVLRGLRRVWAAGWMETVQNCLFTAAAAAVLLGVERSARLALAVHAASQLAALPVAALAIRRALPPKKTPGPFLPGGASPAKTTPGPFFASGLSGLGPELRYSVWVALAEFAWPLLAFVPLWFLSGAHGRAAGDALAAQTRLAAVLTLVGLAVSGATGPHLARQWEAGRRRQALRAWAWWTKLVFAGLSLAATVAIALAPWLLRLLPERYRDVRLLRDCLLFAVLAGGYLMLIWRLRLAERTLWLWLAPLIGAAAISALCAAWVPPFGARGAAVARWVGFLVGCLPIVGIVAADLSSGRPWSLLLPAAPALLYAPWYVAVPASAALVAALLLTDWLSAPVPRTTRSPSGRG
jgi:O-antigen/teichoic acid export membrane protein